MSAGYSLRNRLVAAVVATSAAVIIAAGLALYLLTQASLLKEMDAALVQQAQVMTSVFEWKDGRVDLELGQLSAPFRVASGDSQYFEVWQEGQGLLARSPSLAGAALAQNFEDFPAPQLGSVRLAPDKPVRMVAMTVRPSHEGADDAPGRKDAGAAPRVTLWLASDLGRVDRSLNRLAYLLLAVGLAAVLATAGGVWWAVGHGLRPMRVLARRIADMDESSLGQRVELPLAPLELLSVVGRLNQLLERLEAAFGREKALLANLAHELRTPLAGLGFTLEVGLSRPREAEEYAADMWQCLDICRQMQGMVDNLLTMARLDAGQGQAQERSATDLVEALGQAWAALRDQAVQKGLGVEWEAEPGTSAWIDPYGLLIILRNLLTNAVEYAGTNGRIWINAFHEDGRAVIRVANTGCNLAPEDLARVFERFWRGDSSRSGEQAHAGLGLALSRQLAEGMGGSMAAGRDNQGRFWITLSLPSTQGLEGQCA